MLEIVSLKEVSDAFETHSHKNLLIEHIREYL